MIREDRIQLNERFIRVFELLENRGEIVKNDRNGKGMGDFADKILGNRAYGHIVRAFLNENDKRVIDYHQARALCREYGVNEEYMIDGIGTPFGFDLPKVQDKRGGYDTPIGNILFTTSEAFAGGSIDVGSSLPESQEFFSIPGLSGNGLVAFPINGNSMEPVILDGDIVICKEISSAHDVRDNEIYAVKSNGSLWVKYVKRLHNHRGRVDRIRLISANYLEHDPFDEEVNEYTRLYKVISRVNKL